MIDPNWTQLNSEPKKPKTKSNAHTIKPKLETLNRKPVTMRQNPKPKSINFPTPKYKP